MVYSPRLSDKRFGPYKEYVKGLFITTRGTIHRGLGRPRLRLFEPRAVGWGRELFGTDITIGNEKQLPVPRFSYDASGAPPRCRKE